MGSVTSRTGSMVGEGFLAPSTRATRVGMTDSRWPTTYGMHSWPSSCGGVATTTTPHPEATRGSSQFMIISVNGIISETNRNEQLQ